jgi:hypothetical protein
MTPDGSTAAHLGVGDAAAPTLSVTSVAGPRLRTPDRTHLSRPRGSTVASGSESRMGMASGMLEEKNAKSGKVAPFR